ncbi:trk system potassium uptake protein TrkA [Saccharicrinis carchari]|uniref:Trk system potassium uptake protein TrkA n=1 Tax=Saccharicrinis carchari TaxID=1168039 RepID=A0A521BDY4_SACCC|nr:TrkA family potassium uptake protein [Saccharicrinis carchari]SMO45269.1 trk system potassium uptake protein TrkA [Saccharicrinis carchari]
MNFLIIGLGNFGSSLAIRLTELGHEVIGVDSRMANVEALKNDITHTIRADCTDLHSAMELPISDADAVIMCIGENEGNSIMATAVLKQLNAKRIIGRIVSDTQATVLNAMGIEEIVHPEKDSADKLAKNLTTEGLIDSFELSDRYSIVKIDVPEQYEGKTLQELDLREKFNLTILTTMRKTYKRSLLGFKQSNLQVQGIAKADTVLHKDDIMVVFGEDKDIERFLK